MQSQKLLNKRKRETKYGAIYVPQINRKNKQMRDNSKLLWNVKILKNKLNISFTFIYSNNSFRGSLWFEDKYGIVYNDILKVPTF